MCEESATFIIRVEEYSCTVKMEAILVPILSTVLFLREKLVTLRS
jgi:hypothetical protein